jgi:transcriptional regulator MraZ
VSSFKGTYSYSVDNKGRINIPAKLRKYISPEANDTFVVTRGFDQCLFIYPHDEWSKQEDTIRKLSPSNPQHRYIMRTLLQWATESQLDGQSRVTIPRELLHFASIESEVLIIGVLDHIEVWNPTVYKKYQEAQSDTYENVAQTVFSK